ncbi:uncharacterized protein PPP1R15 [Ochlerotatus camptorhynchus]|uniref:uncharacterized protein PPP1R15 n=1 Tax=Ochlerotatus camptorhynchus TaxID=644619 RepID=UPI0031DB6FF1
MMSNWNQNTRMTSTTAGACPLYTMGRPQSKPLLSVDSNCVTKNGVSSSRSFSTMGIGIIGTILQRVANIFIPNVTQMNTLEINKQSLSAPDIFVDISINTPIFEAAHGKTKLTIPEDEANCDQTKSLTVGNPPFDWCPIRDEVDAMRSTDREELGKNRKRVKAVCNQEASSSMSEHSSIRTRRAVDRSLNVYSKPKGCYKNRKEKDRYNLLIDIMEDVRHISDDNEFDSETENNNPVQSLGYEIRNSICSISFSAKNMTGVLDLSEKSFPAICSPIQEDRNCVVPGDKRESRPSESDSENSFVIFSENVQMTTPSASPPMRRDLCSTINNFFTPSMLERRQRQRQVSECSDDSIVFCYESDQEENVCQHETDLDSDDDSEEETDENSCKDDSEDTISHQPDSGFEERKVQFNLKPEVHVMRTWDFAYRQARKGEWEMAARDRERFKKRIHETEDVLSRVFNKNVRDRVYLERFNYEYEYSLNKDSMLSSQNFIRR